MEQKLDHIIGRIFSCIMIAVLGLLLLYSVISTSHVTAVDEVFYVGDHAWIHAIVILAVTAAVYFIKKKGFILNKKIVAGVGLIAVIIIGIFIYQADIMPKYDQRRVMSIAEFVRMGIYDDYLPGGYLDVYPQQNGVVLLIEILTAIAEMKNYILFQYMNLFMMVLFVAGFILVIKQLLPGYEYATALGVICFLPFWGYATQIYGNVLALAFGTWSMYFTLLYCKNKKISHAFIAGILMMFTVIMKENFLILLIALEIIIFYYLIKEKNIKVVILAILCPVLVFSGLKVTDKIMESQTGIALEQGVSMLSYYAMGMHEHENRGAGWYDGYNEEAYEAGGYNTKKASEIAAEDIKNSYRNFREHPAYLMGFYVRKIACMWNEPTCDSLAMQWGRYPRDEGKESTGFSKLIVNEGSFTRMLTQLMNLCWTPLLFGAFIYFISCMYKDRGFETNLPALLFLGGFLFHFLIWETGSYYTFYYMIMLIPYAISGWDLFVEWLMAQDRKRLIKIFCVFAVITLFLSLPQVASFLTLNRDDARYAEYLANLSQNIK
ncbi:MAG: hypothetical protein K6G03_00560 [Lachnospiraceae bacterium]|nr:hypothetical protein [Lachnospiraceae bacterium]